MNEVSGDDQIIHNNWSLSMDWIGSRLILTVRKREEITYTVWLDLKKSNNESEYESLIAGLQLETKMDCEKIGVLVESMIVANQINDFMKSNAAT